MKLLTLFTLAIATLSPVSAVDQLQIGVKKAIPESQCPRKTKAGDKLVMHYTGTLKSTGEKFDSSRDRDKEFEFTLGAGMVIKGWDTGLLDMCIGEQRKLTIPPHLGYGERGAGPKIGPGATLVFDVELVGIKGYTPPETPDLAGKAEL